MIYDQAGRIEEIHYGHGVKDVFKFDPQGRVKEIIGSSPIAGSSYTYEPNGNLESAIESDGANLRFQYDRLDRLSRANSSRPLPFDIQYRYDVSGNLTSISGPDPTGSVAQAPFRTYATDSNRLLSTRASRATNVFYNEHGSITSYTIGNTSRLMEYDGLGRLQELKGPNGTVKVTYGPSGGKIARKRPNGSHEIYFSGAGGLLTFDQEKDQWRTHISALGRVIATMDHEQNIEFHHANRLSSTAAVTYVDPNTFQIKTKSKTRYLSFGEELKNVGDQSTLEKFAFTNQERDQDMQLYDYGARYYDSVLRRFIQPDSILDTTGESQGQNRYAYVLNNPRTYTDPTGNMPEKSDAAFKAEKKTDIEAQHRARAYGNNGVADEALNKITKMAQEVDGIYAVEFIDQTDIEWLRATRNDFFMDARDGAMIMTDSDGKLIILVNTEFTKGEQGLALSHEISHAKDFIKKRTKMYERRVSASLNYKKYYMHPGEVKARAFSRKLYFGQIKARSLARGYLGKAKNWLGKVSNALAGVGTVFDAIDYVEASTNPAAYITDIEKRMKNYGPVVGRIYGIMNIGPLVIANQALQRQKWH